MSDRASPASRVVLHADLDAFFAAVEQRDNPALRGKPVIVGGSVRRGVVASASYEARRFGVHNAMSMAEALRRCPSAVVVMHHMDRYADASRRFMAILGDFSPTVEALSFDEAFIDLTGSARLLGAPRVVAAEIKRRVVSELALVVSIGIAPIKFAAKIASDIDKPNGLRVVEPDQLLAFLHPLPIGRLWGVGKVAAESLRGLGLTTIGDVARYPEAGLVSRLGPAAGHHLAALARGEDPRAVEEHDTPSSVGHRETFSTDLWELADLEPTLLSQADSVAARLRHAGLRANAVNLTLRYDDFSTITRRTTLADATSDGWIIAKAARELLEAIDLADLPGRRARLVGVTAIDLEARDAPRQLTFDEDRRRRGEGLGDVLDGVKARFGDGAVKRAVHLDDKPRSR